MRPIGCGELEKLGKWSVERCCDDCHSNRHDARFVMLISGSDVKLDVCCLCGDNVALTAADFLELLRKVGAGPAFIGAR